MRKLAMTRELSQQINEVKEWLKGREIVYVEQVWCSALGKSLADYDRRASVRMSIILVTYCGWVKSGIRERIDGVQKWMYRPSIKNSDFKDVLG